MNKATVLWWKIDYQIIHEPVIVVLINGCSVSKLVLFLRKYSSLNILETFFKAKLKVASFLELSVFHCIFYSFSPSWNSIIYFNCCSYALHLLVTVADPKKKKGTCMCIWHNCIYIQEIWPSRLLFIGVCLMITCMRKHFHGLDGFLWVGDQGGLSKWVTTSLNKVLFIF